MPRKGVQFTFLASLISTQNSSYFVDDPTLAAGDITVVGNSTNLGNITTLPTAIVSNTRVLRFTLSASEMNYDRIAVLCHDVAGAEWNDLIITINTGCCAEGATEYEYTVTNSVTLLPEQGVKVWITTDLAGSNIIWSGYTDTSGIARDTNGNEPFLDAGTYYFWKSKPGFIDDQNPDTEVVT